jgi:hypothetical protein
MRNWIYHSITYHGRRSTESKEDADAQWKQNQEVASGERRDSQGKEHLHRRSDDSGLQSSEIAARNGDRDGLLTMTTSELRVQVPENVRVNGVDDASIRKHTDL